MSKRSANSDRDTKGAKSHGSHFCSSSVDAWNSSSNHVGCGRAPLPSESETIKNIDDRENSTTRSTRERNG